MKLEGKVYCVVLEDECNGRDLQQQFAEFVAICDIEEEFQRFVDDRFIVAPVAEVTTHFLPNDTEGIEVVCESDVHEEVAISLEGVSDVVMGVIAEWLFDMIHLM